MTTTLDAHQTLLNGRSMKSLAAGQKNGASDDPRRTEGLLFKSICTLQKYKTIVEIGTQFGETSFYLAEAAKINGGKLYCYDYFAPIGAYKKGGHGELEVAKDRLKDYSEFVTFTKIDTQSESFKDVLSSDTEGKIDFAFIDGDHSYEGVKNDFLAVYPLLTNDATIALHDTGNHIGVRKFIIELLSDLYDGSFSLINFPYGGADSNGLAILKKDTWARENKGISFDHLIHRSPADTVVIHHGRDGEIDKEEIYKKETNWLNNRLKIK